MPLPRSVTIALIVGAAIAAGILGVMLPEWWAPHVSPPRPNAIPARPPAATTRLVYAPTVIGTPAGTPDRPLVTNVHLADLDGDGLLDVLYCEGQRNTVRWIRQSPRGVFTETIIAENIPGPAHVSTADINRSGRLDVLVASMGQITPNNDRIGAVVVLENLGAGRFQPHELLANTARVTDVRAANLAGHTDGRLDLVVGQFGYAQGETRWMKNLGSWRFESHIVNTLSGCVHTPVADFDRDGRVDFAALISQEWEEVHWFRNRGQGQFDEAIVWGTTNEDFGSSGLEAADLNGDGFTDLVYTNGDGFDYAGYGTRAWHGLQWLKNEGNGRFTYHRLGDLPGAYAPCVADLDGDGFLDVLTVSGFANWSDPKAVSMMAWLNDGRERFTPIVLAHRPTQLITAAVGDLDGNGVPVIVTGGFHAYPPFEHVSNITLWRRQ